MRISIIDDHKLFLAGMAQLLSSLDSTAQVTTATTIDQFQAQLADDSQPDLVVLDYHLPNSLVKDNIRRLRAMLPTARIVIVSAETDPNRVIEVLHHGATGFVPKSAETSVLSAALQLIVAGGVYIPSFATQTLQNTQHSSETYQPWSKLSPRQKQVLRLAINGASNATIAQELGISIVTVKVHLGTCYKVLNVRSRTQAIVLCHQLGILL